MMMDTSSHMLEKTSDTPSHLHDKTSDTSSNWATALVISHDSGSNVPQSFQADSSQVLDLLLIHSSSNESECSARTVNWTVKCLRECNFGTGTNNVQSVDKQSGLSDCGTGDDCDRPTPQLDDVASSGSVQHSQMQVFQCAEPVDAAARIIDHPTIFTLNMNAHFAGCLVKTVVLSPRFIELFVRHIRSCVRVRRSRQKTLNRQRNFGTKCDEKVPKSSGGSVFQNGETSKHACVGDTSKLLIGVHKRSTRCRLRPGVFELLQDCTQNHDVMLTRIIDIRIVFPDSVWLDMAWWCRVEMLIIKCAVLDDAMNWLSTLGGAYSALGDYFPHHAESAARISVQQLCIAMEMGSPDVIARCHLYLALSAMQQGNLRRAKSIIRYQYRRAKQWIVIDTRLLAMCRGLWSRLRYMYSLRSSRRGHKQLARHSTSNGHMTSRACS